MKMLTVLIILQALSASAFPVLPFQKRQAAASTCPPQVTVTNIVTVTAPQPTTSLPPPDIVQLGSNTATIGGIFIQITTTSVQPSVSVVVSTSSGVVQVLPTLSTQMPNTAGVVSTGVRSGVNPVSTAVVSSSIAILSTQAVTSVPSGPSSTIAMSANIFQPIATGAPPASIPSRGDSPVARLGIQPQTSPLQTNKFYANFFLGSQTAATWTQPYSMAWSKGGGSQKSWGLSIAHIDASQKVFGPSPLPPLPTYFINPIGIQYLILSAVELSGSTVLTTNHLTAGSVNVNLSPSQGKPPLITFPLVQGMGFVTAVYSDGTPTVQSGVFFRTLTRSTQSNLKPGITKYTILLEDGHTWLLYAWSPSGASLGLTVVTNGLIQATSNWDGIIQVAKNEGGAAAEAVYDQSAGSYATSSTVAGSTAGAVGTYQISYTKAGLVSSPLIMFALPHHVQSFAGSTKSALANITLQTTTKGVASAIVADSWTLVEPNMPVDMGFAPWSPTSGSKNSLSAAAIAAIQGVAASEISQDMMAQSNLNSFYFGGKGLAKFASIVYTMNDLLNKPALAQAGLSNLKAAFEIWATNKNQFPLAYDAAWGGVVSSAGFKDIGSDFGNTIYNDHHFHFAYFIFTAAIIGHLDPTWLAAHKDYVNTLVRDTSNPSPLDNYFPVSRAFDWYHGHSWAHGITESYDGKDEESSSEDSMFAYALKMWGKTIGDANMEARGNLQLAITARSLQNYFLLQSNNVNQPANFIDNKVTGILFENKVDHTTYFGANIEYIQGIHMLPLMPHSTLTRTQTFVTEEWNKWFSNGRAEAVTGGWKGILFANYAIINPTAAFNFFSASSFDMGWLDGGASRTWYMALAAGLGGA